jgi:NTP pyrophosphatase (non-canonical NTP hydrolase)
MNEFKETKSEIRARIDEINSLLKDSKSIYSHHLDSFLVDRALKLQSELESADEDLFTSILESHKAICEAKNMGAKEAYGQDPASYYTMAICGESGELANAMTKAKRNGFSLEKILEAVKSELPDVVIYSFVLAHVLDINLNELVREKVEIVIQRAKDGYYGGKIEKSKVYFGKIEGRNESGFDLFGSGEYSISLDGIDQKIGEVRIKIQDNLFIEKGEEMKALIESNLSLGYDREYYIYKNNRFVGTLSISTIFG